MRSSRKICSQLVHVVGFSNGWELLALKKPPPLVPSSLMISWLATGPPVMCCVAAGQGVHVGAGGEVLDHPGGHEDDGADQRDRQQDAQHDPGQVDPEVAQVGGLPSREATDERDRDRDADRRRGEVLHGQPGHLDQVAHRRLARVRLPVRVGHEADRGVPRQRGRHVGKAQGQQQVALHALEDVEEHDRDGGERQHAAGVHRPRLLAVRLHPEHAVDAALDPPVPVRADHAVHVVAERPVGHGEREYQRGDEENSGRRVAHQNRSGKSRATTRKTVRTAASTRPTRLAALTAAPLP